MSTILLSILGILSAVILHELWGRWAYHEFYFRDRSPAELRYVERLRSLAVLFLALAVLLSFVVRQGPATWVASAFGLMAIGLLIRASQRTTTARTVAAIGLILATLGLVVWAVRFAPAPGTGAGATARIIAVALAAVIMLFTASRLSRPRRG